MRYDVESEICRKNCGKKVRSEENSVNEVLCTEIIICIKKWTVWGKVNVQQREEHGGWLMVYEEESIECCVKYTDKVCWGS